MSEEEKKTIDLELYNSYISDIGITRKTYEKLHSNLNLLDKQQKEIKKYKRYFKLAISDLQSEGYMQMPYKNIEKYYSKREDIV